MKRSMPAEDGSRRSAAPPVRRALRWTALFAATALVPKCVACLAAYLAVGAGLGRLGVELCGQPSPAASAMGVISSSTWIIAWLAIASLAGALLLVRRRGR